jgi:hypothetical protein
VAAKSCVDKPVEMINAMDEGVDKLPQLLQDVIERNDDGDDDLDDVNLRLFIGYCRYQQRHP